MHLHLLLALVLVAIAPMPSFGQGTAAGSDVLLIVDDFQATSRMTQGLRRFVDRLVREILDGGGRTAIATTSAEPSAATFTSSLEELSDVIGGLTAQGLEPDAVLESRKQAEGEAYKRATQALSRAAAVLTATVAARKETRMEVIFISPGWERPQGVSTDALGDAALAADVVVHTVDLRAVADDRGPNSREWRAYVQASRAALAGLAARTRGIPVFSNVELEELRERYRKRK